MAEKTDKGDRGFLARTASITSKRAKRAQEKVMQKLGKANETKDITFDEFVTNFSKQQGAAQRLHKELKNYHSCVKAMLLASDAFGDAVREVYEPDWPGCEKLIQHLDELHNQWYELQEKLHEEVIIPLTAYQSQFPDIKARINKRGRKLVDYDRYRHNLETLKARGKTGDPKKLTQAEEEYNEAKTVYTKLHAELYEELPALFDSRIGYYVSSFQSIFTAEGVFHREAAKTKTKMNDLMDGLIEDMSTGTYTIKRPYPAVSENQISDSDDTDAQTTSSHPESGEAVVCFNDEVVTIDSGEDGTVVQSEKIVDGEEASNPLTQSDNEEQEGVAGGEPEEKPEEKPKPVPAARPSPPQVDNTAMREKPQLPPLPANRQQPQTVNTESGSPSTETAPSPVADVTTSQTEGVRQEVATSDIPGLLYKVRAAHKYVAEDDDELSFEKGEIISVVEFEDPDEQDDGWLMGILELSGIKGVFPANFTKKI